MVDPADFTVSRRQIEALTAPSNVAFVGITDREGAWAASVWRNFCRHEFAGEAYLVNPRRTELFGRRCYAALTDLPQPPDHVVVMVPAKAVADSLREAAAAGARSATVFAAGFDDSYGEEGRRLKAELQSILAQTGLGITGPNCMGNVIGRSRLMTLVDERPLRVERGPVALVGQSGGVMMFLAKVLEERGIQPGYVITSGNELGITTPDYIEFMAADPDVRVIVCYLEGVKDLPRFTAACSAARNAGKPVIAIKLGASDAGRAAAIAHTGSLAGSIEVFDAVTQDLGVIRAPSLDDAVELCELLLHSGAPTGTRLGGMTYSGSFRGLLLDAAATTSLCFPTLAAPTLQRLDSLLAVGTYVSNPVDGGFSFLTSQEAFMGAVEALNDDDTVDMLLIQEELPREPQGSEGTLDRLRAVGAFVASGRARKPIAIVSLVSHTSNDYSRALRNELRVLSFLEESNKALRTIGLAQRRVAAIAARASVDNLAAPTLTSEANAAIRALAGVEGVVDELRSKALLTAFDIAIPKERLARSASDAGAAADAIGYPVVLKIVAEGLAHKSDVGGVLLDLRDRQAVQRGYDSIVAAVTANSPATPIQGVLVCQQVSTGPELVVAVHRDAEMGLVAMAGSGGVLLELSRDTAFSALPLTEDRALGLLARTKADHLLSGYRGSPPCDRAATARVLVALGRIAAALGDRLETLEINPLRPLRDGSGSVALDALLVLRTA